MSMTERCRITTPLSPQSSFVQLQAMSPEERKIYDLVLRRFLAALLPAAVFREVSLTGEAAGEEFTAGAENLVLPGWREAYEEPVEERRRRRTPLKIRIFPGYRKGSG